MSQPKDTWDMLVQWVPSSLQPEFWQAVSKIRKIPASDDIVSLIAGMGILTLLLRQMPEMIAQQKLDWERRSLIIQRDLQQREASAIEQLQKGAQNWNEAVDSLEAHQKEFQNLVGRMEAALKEMSGQMTPLEAMSAKADQLLNLFNESIARSEKARDSTRIILMRWSYINAGTSAVLIIWIVLWIALR